MPRGPFATAIVGMVDKHVPAIIPLSLCIVAAILAGGFAFIDTRNQFLVRLSEEVLFQLEQEKIFGKDITITSRSNEQIPFGILATQVFEDKKYEDCWVIYNILRGKHRVWLRLVSILLAVTFLTAAILIAVYGLPLPPSKA